MTAEKQEKLAVIVLAAGKGTRLRHPDSKMLAHTGFDTLLGHVFNTVKLLNPEQATVVVGHGKEKVEEFCRAKAEGLGITGLSFAVQEVLDGTGSAVRAALPALEGFEGNVLILSGDVPLLRSETIKGFIDSHTSRKATLSVLSASLDDPAAYGRILRDEAGEFIAIREFKDCNLEQRAVREINAGIYLVDSAFLAPAIDELTNDNAQNEYYLTDIIERAHTEGQRVVGYEIHNEQEILGVNLPSELAQVQHVLRRRKVRELINEGVLVEHPGSLFISPETEIAPGASIGPNVIFKGKCRVGAGAVIEGSCHIKDSEISDNSLIRFGCYLNEAKVGKEVSVGPFAHLRPEAELEDEVRVGNFVEIKKSQIKKGAKVPHLSYVGDAEVGEKANIGAGTITCNYDGYKKSKTTVGAGAFIGSNSVLVAPVEIEEEAFVAAASTITKTVKSGSLALSRADQKAIPGWVEKRKKRAEREKK